MAAPPVLALVKWPSAPLTNSLVLDALQKSGLALEIHADKLPEDIAARDVLQWSTYDDTVHELTLRHPRSTRVLTSAYTIRKALIRKHFLSRSAHQHCVKHPDSPLSTGVPRTWDIELQFADELDEMWADELWDLGAELDRGAGRWMILKPGMADRGMGIRLFHTKAQLEGIFAEFEDGDDDDDDEDEEEEDEDDQRADRAPGHDGTGTGVVTSQLRHFVIQEYLERPLLIDPAQIPLDGSPPAADPPDLKGHKFHLRVYCAASGALRVFLYDRILALFASVPYAPPSAAATAADPNADLAAHLTNTCLQADHGADASVRLLAELVGCRALGADNEGEGTVTPQDVADITDQAARLLGAAFAAALGTGVHFQPLPNAFELFGVDFLVTHHRNRNHGHHVHDGRRFHVSLLELNAEPAVEMTGARLAWVLEDLFGALAQTCVVPFFRAQSAGGNGGGGNSGGGGREDDAEWAVGETRGHLRKCLDVVVRGVGGW